MCLGNEGVSVGACVREGRRPAKWTPYARTHRAFTMVELMVVVLIVGVLAAVAIPMMKGRTDASKWSEAKTAMGTIATALRTYGTEKGSFTGIPSFTRDRHPRTSIWTGPISPTTAYAITSASASNGLTSFVITCTAADSKRAEPRPAPPS